VKNEELLTPSILVFTATYNESDNIIEWYQRVRKALPTTSILVVDDNSPDGTATLIRNYTSNDHNFELIVREGKLGLGSAHRLAIEHSLRTNFDVLITMDADLSHQPEELDRFIAAIASHDFVIGTRSGAGKSDYTGLRKYLSWAGNTAARICIPTGLTEYTTSMRAFNRDALEILSKSGLRDDGYAFFMEVVYFLHVAGLRLTEVPIHFMDRIHGTSKIPRAQIFVSAATLARLSMRRLKRSQVTEHHASSAERSGPVQ